MVAACFESQVSSSISQMVMEINVNPPYYDMLKCEQLEGLGRHKREICLV